MKQTIGFCQFCDAFRDMGRGDSFSYDGKKALFEWLEELSDDCGTEIELDVIALDCEFAEYESRDEAAAEYGEEVTPENLEEWTTVIEFNGGIIIQTF